MDYTFTKRPNSGLKIVIVNGRPGSGKTTFEEFCREILGDPYCEMRSTIDKVKDIAYQIGWNGEKDARSRKFLSDLKDLCEEYNEMSTQDILFHINDWEEELIYYDVPERFHVFFIDDREPEHIEKLKQLLDAQTLLIRRPGDEELETSNHADEKVFDYTYDFIIENHSDLDYFKQEAELFIQLLKGEVEIEE